MMKGEMNNIGRPSLEEFKIDANDAIHMKLVSSKEDLEDESKTFKPVMSHQIFGKNELIFGYSNLEVQLYYSACKLTTYINLKYKDIVTTQQHDLKPDDVVRSLTKYLPTGFSSNLDIFISSLDTEKDFKPFGDLIHSYSKNKANIDRKFEIYKTTIESPGFKDFHERLQTFLLWYVDAASFIDTEEDHWSYYLIFEKCVNGNGDALYKIVGYQTVYSYYAWPDKIRPRISQVLILPPYQRQGHGAELLETFYRQITPLQNVLDITVEDPSEAYQRLRDFVDVKNCQQLECFSLENLMKGFNKDMVTTVQSRLKLNPKQCRRVYEILKLRHMTRDTLSSYRLEIKRRLFQPFQKSKKDVNKLKQVLTPEEFEAGHDLTKEQKHAYLEKSYQELTLEYRHILECIAAS